MASYFHVKGNLINDNGTWAVRARVYNPSTGKTHQRPKSTGFKVKDSSKRKAEQAMQDILFQWEKESNTEIVARNPLFEDYVQIWINKKTLILKANTMKSYISYADANIIPALGKFKVRRITLRHLQTYYGELLKTLSVNSVKKYHVVIKGALLEAVRDGVINTNFADYVEFPKAVKYEGKAYSESQVSALLNAIQREGEPIQAAITLAVCYGLRRSEICGLRWSDVNFETGKMYIKNTVTQNGSLKLETERTKTEKSRRVIDLMSVTIPYLLQLKQRQESAGIKLDKICVWPDGRPVRPDYITKKSRMLLKKYGLEHIRVHDYRHTAASLMATQATPKQVQMFLGHEDISTTMNTYVHIFDADRKAASDIMNSILEKSQFCSDFCSE